MHLHGFINVDLHVLLRGTGPKPFVIAKAKEPHVETGCPKYLRRAQPPPAYPTSHKYADTVTRNHGGADANPNKRKLSDSRFNFAYFKKLLGNGYVSYDPVFGKNV